MYRNRRKNEILYISKSFNGTKENKITHIENNASHTVNTDKGNTVKMQYSKFLFLDKVCLYFARRAAKRTLKNSKAEFEGTVCKPVARVVLSRIKRLSLDLSEQKCGS